MTIEKLKEKAIELLENICPCSECPVQEECECKTPEKACGQVILEVLTEE